MKKSKRRIKFSNKIAYIIIIAALLATFCYAVVQKNRLYNEAIDLTGTVSVRELILKAADGTKTDAPIDPKTGDIYFPQAMLYLPSNTSYTRLTYAYDPLGQDGPELNISDRSVFNRNAVKLYSAKNVDEVFSAVPKLQSCQRGIKLLYQKISNIESSNELNQTIKLSNGKTLYVYLESTCPELKETAQLISNIKPY